MQRTTLYKHTRAIAAVIIVVSMLAAGTAAGMMMKAGSPQTTAKVDYVGRFVVTPHASKFISPADAPIR